MASADDNGLFQLSLCREGRGCLDCFPLTMTLKLFRVPSSLKTEVWRDLVLLRICCFCRHLHLRVERLLLLRQYSDTHLMHTLRQIEEAGHSLRLLLRGLEQRDAIPVNVVGLRAVHSDDSFLLFLLGLGRLVLPVSYGLACSLVLG